MRGAAPRARVKGQACGAAHLLTRFTPLIGTGLVRVAGQPFHDRKGGIAALAGICDISAMLSRTPDTLPDGVYPFATDEYPLATMAMAEAPAELEVLLKSAARESGIEIIRDIPVELICRTPDGLNPTFMVWWPHGSDRLHILTPKELIQGRA